MFRLLEAAIVIVLSFPLAVLPYKGALKAGEILGLFFFHAWAGRRKIAVGNIERAIQSGALAVPELSSPEDPHPQKSEDFSGATVAAAEIAKESFINLGKSFIEVIRIYFGFGDALIDGVVIRGTEHFRKAKEQGRGIIIITGHCGNWELMALAFGVKVAHASVVARAQDNPYLNRMIGKVRARHGNSIIYKKGALKGILSCLKKEGVVGILMDQAVVKEEGFVIDFLGRGAWTTKMPALIARKTGAPVVPVFINREGASHVITIHPEVELRREEGTEALKEDTQRLSSHVEECIRQHPSEWLWIHRRWKRVEQRMKDE
ncbi:MAG: lysophospholipid acyltransferase family protein [Nitrospirae bacterium]|nr:lysophospholipid acyltransferase family protein [Nitrospirota bacterium]